MGWWPGERQVFLRQHDRLAVRRSRRGVGPGVFERVQLLGTAQAFVDDERLERVEPVRVVSVAAVGVAGGLCALDGPGQGLRPLGPAEGATFVQRQHEREGLRLPGGGEGRRHATVGQQGGVGAHAQASR